MKSDKISVFITGISGRFPEADNIDEFMENLYNKKDCFRPTNERWPSGLYDLPKCMGLLKDISKFDAELFNIKTSDADSLDPQVRILIETVYEAVFDAGLTLNDIRNKRTGFFIGSMYDEYDRQLYSLQDEYLKAHQYISSFVPFILNMIGPVYHYETACSSSFSALTEAFIHLENNLLDTAIVATCSINPSPILQSTYKKLGLLSERVNFLDARADGYGRGEAVITFILQKKSLAKRIYCQIINIRSNSNGFIPEGITYPSFDGQSKLIKLTHKEKNINNEDLEYLECHGTGTKSGDLVEITSIYKTFFEKARKVPLLIGSVKTNIGHTEASSGLVSLSKVCFVIENRLIPPNMNFQSLAPHLKDFLSDETLKPILTITPLKGKIISINNFGFGGANTYCVIKIPENYVDNSSFSIVSKNIYRLINICGRNSEAVKYMMHKIKMRFKNKNLSKELLSLVYMYSKMKRIDNMLYRGYLILSNEEDNEIEYINEVPEKQPSLVFLFGGAGCEWRGMGKSLMNLEPFERSMKECYDIITNDQNLKDVDLLAYLLDKEVKKGKEISRLVSLSAFQLSLIDLMLFLEIKPDQYIGHSFGEFSCAYLDGLLTKKEILKCALAIDKYCKEIFTTECAMTSIGMEWNRLKNICPPNIYPACFNASDNISVGGIKKDLDSWLKELTNKKIFFRNIASNGYAFHTPLMAKNINRLIELFNECITDFKKEKRSSKWITVQLKYMENLNEPISIAEYFAHNACYEIYFDKACKNIKNESVCLELSPKKYISPLVRRNQSNINISIATVNSKAANDQGLSEFFQMLGTLYTKGYDPAIHKIYPRIKYPLLPGTGSFSSLIKLNHDRSYFLRKYPDFFNKTTDFRKLDLKNENYRFLIDHQINGFIIVPEAALIYYVWSDFCLLLSEKMENFSVLFENIEFKKELILDYYSPKQIKVNFIQINDSRYKFSLFAKNQVFVDGYVREIDDNAILYKNEIKNEERFLKKDEIYYELTQKGYNYGKEFRCLKKLSLDGSFGIIRTNSWISAVNALFKAVEFKMSTRHPHLILRIGELKCTCLGYFKNQCSQDISYFYEHSQRSIYSSFIECRILSFYILDVNANLMPSLKEIFFLPYNFTSESMESRQILMIMISIVIENLNNHSLKVLNDENEYWQNQINETFNELLILDFECPCCGKNKVKISFNEISELSSLNTNENFDLILSRQIYPLIAEKYLKQGGFILLIATDNSYTDYLNEKIRIVAQTKYEDKNFILLRKLFNFEYFNIINFNSKDLSWIESINRSNNVTWLIAKEENMDRCIGLVRNIRRQIKRNQLRCIIDEKNLLSSSEINSIISLDLIMNIYLNGKLGFYYRLPIENLSNNIQTLDVYLNVEKPGDLDSLKWFELNIPSTVQQYHVSYSSLNFNDLMLVSEQFYKYLVKHLQTPCAIGLEFSGKDLNGNRIAGITSYNGLATKIVASEKQFVWKVPEEWTLEEAATFPVAYATAYYALIIRGKLKKGESVLIHSGSDAVSQAGIKICLSYECKIFTTYESIKKKEFLLRTFPEINANYIINLYDENLEDFIIRYTEGLGVDIIFNSSAQTKLEENCRCLRMSGRFLEIGCLNMIKNQELGLGVFLKNITFHGINLDHFLNNDNDISGKMKEIKTKIINLVENGIKSGVVKPIIFTTFSKNEIKKAFELMKCGKHMGKILIKMQDNSLISIKDKK